MGATSEDVICIGGGTVAEGVCNQLQGSGLRILVVERELVGGECPYWGCIPSKTLLRSAEVLAEAARARDLAASSVEWRTDFGTVSRRTHEMARNLDDSGAEKALEKQGARVVRGAARLTGPRTVVVGDETFTAARGIVIGTGTDASIPDVPGLRHPDTWTNREAVLAEALPESLIVIGGGPIGAELGQGFARLGTQVTIVEVADRILAPEDPAASEILAAQFAKEGIAVRTGAQFASVEHHGGTVTVHLDGGTPITAERLLVAAGRRPRVEGLDLEGAGIRQDKRGFISVNPATLEAAPGIWAGGDITGIGAFTHLAWYHGNVIGKRLLGRDARADHRALPRVTFTDPEVAAVGTSAAAARDELGASCRVVKERVSNTARGAINGEPDGFVQLVADTARGVLVGGTAVGPRSGEIISELALAIRAEVPLPVFADTMHPFPTFSRILDGLAAQLAAG